MSGDDGAQERELEVLIPDVDCPVRDPDTGETVTLTVREFRFREGLEVQVEARGLIASLAALVNGEEIAPVDIAATIGADPDLWMGLVARAAERDPEWIARLDDRSAEALDDAMWTANGPFFCRRAVRQALGKRSMANLYLQGASFIRSSRQAMAGRTDTGESSIASPSARSGSSGEKSRSANADASS